MNKESDEDSVVSPEDLTVPVVRGDLRTIGLRRRSHLPSPASWSAFEGGPRLRPVGPHFNAPRQVIPGLD